MKESIARYLFWFIFMGILLSGCTTKKKVLDYLEKHPSTGAVYCSQKWPVQLIDSNITIDSSKKANNTDWSGRLDSLYKLAKEGANTALLPADIAPDSCQKKYTSLANKFIKVSEELSKIRDAYKKCESDTVYINKTYKIKDTATEKVLWDSIKNKEEENIKITEQKNSLEKHRRILILIVLSGCVFAVLKLKGKI